MRPILSLAVLVAAAAPLLAPAFASAQDASRVGMLECNVSGGVGFVITSARALSCVFRGRRVVEYYSGTVQRFGLDVGVTGPGKLAWAIFAPARGWRPGALAGEYVGASGEVTAGAGVGVNALVGGFRRSISLQPFSVQAQTGISLAAGVGALTLEPSAGPRSRRPRD